MIWTNELIMQTILFLLLGIMLVYPILDYFINKKVRKINQEKFNIFNKKTSEIINIYNLYLILGLAGFLIMSILYLFIIWTEMIPFDINMIFTFLGMTVIFCIFIASVVVLNKKLNEVD